MIKLREIVDDKTSISSTRWAFATVIRFDIFIITGVLIAYIIGHFIGKPFDNTFISNAALLMGVLTGIITTSKALQGFETKQDFKPPEELKIKKSTDI